STSAVSDSRHPPGRSGASLSVFAFVLDRSPLAHPDVPSDWASFLIGDWVACQFEDEFDLAVMVALVPDHVLEEKDGVVVMKVHSAAGFDAALYRVPHHLA